MVRRKNCPAFGMTLPFSGRRSGRAGCARGSHWTLWHGGSKPPLKRASYRVTDKRASHAGGRPFLRPYPRTEPRKTAQRRGVERNQIPDQTPEAATRPPRIPPAALRAVSGAGGGSLTPPGSSSLLRCAGAPWFGTGLFAQGPARRSSSEGVGIAPDG